MFSSMGVFFSSLFLLVTVRRRDCFSASLLGEALVEWSLYGNGKRVVLRSGPAGGTGFSSAVARSSHRHAT